LRAIRELYPSSMLPVIMCTAIGEEDLVVAAIQACANDYVTKQISLPILRVLMAAQFAQLALIDTLGSAKEAAEQRLGEQARMASDVDRREPDE
jgi:DNA-binding response OmpR family regulator